MRIPNQSPAVNRTIGVGASSIKPSQVFSRVSLPSRTDAFLLDLEPRVVFATTDVRCGKTVYTISTGTKQGQCGTNAAGGKTTDGHCEDGSGNKAAVDCSWNNGEGKCGVVEGSGSCLIKRVS
jgi:hypothetical protein